eukprot:CAMPEP_0174706984 /NCGR_PEP_ID=MMETSP1094-20130205/9642_1 /TAXON_ID=156173 /ORGANISM="Chrysochromulina brevifilum, Strain UTEX LB 985" /LENGTH=90 /DNA_ID=CAMNT_0015905319 /DNA_START=278 /DNA_END=551 /DNA_ORIENTATION=+
MQTYSQPPPGSQANPLAAAPLAGSADTARGKEMPADFEDFPTLRMHDAGQAARLEREMKERRRLVEDVDGAQAERAAEVHAEEHRRRSLG